MILRRENKENLEKGLSIKTVKLLDETESLFKDDLFNEVLKEYLNLMRYFINSIRDLID